MPASGVDSRIPRAVKQVQTRRFAFSTLARQISNVQVATAVAAVVIAYNLALIATDLRMLRSCLARRTFWLGTSGDALYSYTVQRAYRFTRPAGNSS